MCVWEQCSGVCTGKFCCYVSTRTARKSASRIASSRSLLAAQKDQYTRINGVNDLSDDEDVIPLDIHIENLLAKKHVLLCKWRVCVAWGVIIVTTVVLISLLVIFLWLVPHLAQQSARNTKMSHSNVVIYNISEDSLYLNATMNLDNAGSYKAKMHDSSAELYARQDTVVYNETTGEYENLGAKLGDLHLPTIHIEANTGASFNISAKVSITNMPGFKKDLKFLLSGGTLKWFIVSKPRVAVHFGSILLHFNIHSNNSIDLVGTTLSNMHSTNMTVKSATTDEIHAISAMSMASSADLTIIDGESADDFSLSVSKHSTATRENLSEAFTFEMRDNETDLIMGYASMFNLVFVTGLNNYDGVVITLIRTANNTEQMARLLATFLEQKTQRLNVVGPVDYFGRVTCIDNTLSSSVLISGSTGGRTAVAGLVTEESSLGWEVTLDNGTKVQVYGAYSTMYNPLNVPIRMSNINAYLTLMDVFRWDVAVPLTKRLYTTVQCNLQMTNDLSQMSSGYGMYKDDPMKTYVDIAPMGRKSMFTIGSPMPGMVVSDVCMVEYPYPCCYLFEFTAAACYYNQNLKGDSMDQVENPYIWAHIQVNFTTLVDGEFEIDLVYYQEFFPVYFGTSVTTGYEGDEEIGCDSITFYSQPNDTDAQYDDHIHHDLYHYEPYRYHH